MTPSDRAGIELAPYRISDRDFSLFQSLIQGEVGIQIPESKRPLLVGRLARRLRELKIDDFGAYYRRVTKEGDEAERVRMLDLISTNETHFFREPKQFEFLEHRVLPAWLEEAAQGRRPRRVRVWSAACSTGEEPYSIGMLLLACLPDWQIEILGTDVSTRVIAKARAALWPIERSRDIPERHLKAFMLRGVGQHQGYMKAGSRLRSVVRIDRLNLHSPRYDVDGLFDLIFCRNVLIYFSPAGRAEVVGRLIGRLGPGGCFFLGHAETLNGITDRLRSAGPAVYSWADASRERKSRSSAEATHLQRYPIAQARDERRAWATRGSMQDAPTEREGEGEVSR